MNIKIMLKNDKKFLSLKINNLNNPILLYFLFKLRAFPQNSAAYRFCDSGAGRAVWRLCAIGRLFKKENKFKSEL